MGIGLNLYDRLCCCNSFAAKPNPVRNWNDASWAANVFAHLSPLAK